MKNDKITRREFIEKTTLTVASAAALPSALEPEVEAKTKLPERVLGRTGVKVPIIAFGCGSRFLMYESEDEALREVEKSLKRLQTDRVDLLHLHSLTTGEDLQKIEAKDGAMKALYELREQKVARFIGMTSHTDGAVMAKAIEHNDLDCVQMAMNPARALQFEELALPAAKKKNLGVILMKVTAQEKLLGAGSGKAGIEPLIRYALSLPVSTAVIGMPMLQFIDQNIAIAKSFNPMNAGEMDQLRAQVASQRVSLENFFIRHRDEAV